MANNFMNIKDIIMGEWITNKLIIDFLGDFPEFSEEIIKNVKLIESLNGDNASVYIRSFSLACLNFRSICTFIDTNIHISISLIAEGESFSKCLKTYNTTYNVVEDTKTTQENRYLLLAGYRQEIFKDLNKDLTIKKDDIKNIDIINIFKSKEPSSPRFHLLNVEFIEGFTPCSNVRALIDRKDMVVPHSYFSVF